MNLKKYKGTICVLSVFGLPYDFQRGMCTLKIIGIDSVFFQPRHIEYALGVKTVVRARRATQRVERGSRKKCYHLQPEIFHNSLRSEISAL